MAPFVCLCLEGLEVVGWVHIIDITRTSARVVFLVGIWEWVSLFFLSFMGISHVSPHSCFVVSTICLKMSLEDLVSGRSTEEGWLKGVKSDCHAIYRRGQSQGGQVLCPQGDYDCQNDPQPDQTIVQPPSRAPNKPHTLDKVRQSSKG